MDGSLAACASIVEEFQRFPSDSLLLNINVCYARRVNVEETKENEGTSK